MQVVQKHFSKQKPKPAKPFSFEAEVEALAQEKAAPADPASSTDRSATDCGNSWVAPHPPSGWTVNFGQRELHCVVQRDDPGCHQVKPKLGMHKTGTGTEAIAMSSTQRGFMLEPRPPAESAADPAADPNAA